MHVVFVAQANAQAIEQLGYYHTNGIHAMDFWSNILVLGDGQLINVSNPFAPELLGRADLDGFSTSVVAEGDYAYFGTGMHVNLKIADISNPEIPNVLGSIFFPDNSEGIFGLTKNDSVLYAAMGSAGIYSIDISDKSAPFVLDKMVIANGQARDVITKSGYAFVAHKEGLYVIDISDPSDMQAITSIGSGYNSIDIGENYAFMCKSYGGIDVFDITDPRNPVPAFSVPKAGMQAWDIKYANNLIYLASDTDGLFVFALEGNTATEMAKYANTGNGQSFAVCVQDSLIFLSDLIKGVAVLKYDPTGTVNTHSVSETPTFIMYPNPARDYLTICAGVGLTGKVELIDLKGKVIVSETCGFAGNTIDVSEIPAGRYLVRIETLGHTMTEQLLILH